MTPMFTIDKTISRKKTELLSYFRDRAEEALGEIRLTYGSKDYKEQASAINKALTKSCESLLSTIKQQATVEKWSNDELLRAILLVTYCFYVVMLESRNDVWPYDYMTFSRRIGELWDPFCKLCFHTPLKPLTLFIPPLFSEVKRKLAKEIEDYIDGLSITPQQKNELKKYYHKVWGLVTSGEISMELDLHFESAGQKVVVDFKSGFGSNEKGNTNRLLLVATIYKNLADSYKCLLLVRSAEDSNNNYFKVLKTSGIWDAYCGDEAYTRMMEYSGFDLKKWIKDNIQWDARAYAP